MNYDQQSIQILPIQNQQVVASKKGPRAARLVLDFSVNPHYDLDMQHVQSTNQFDLCQTLWIDNADGGSNVIVTIGGSGQRIVAKANSQGYYNVMAPNPIKMGFDGAGGNPVMIDLIDVAIPGVVWSAV